MTISRVFLEVWRYRQLLFLMVRREVSARYRGSVMGLAWAMLSPVLMLAVYTFVFGVVFNARWGIQSDSRPAEFSILLFMGMLAHGLFSECLTRAPSLIITHANLVKKVVFPLEILPLTLLGSALFNSAVNMLVLFLGMLVFSMPFQWGCFLLPLVFLPLALLSLGVACLFSALGVYVRDVAQLTGLMSTLALFLSPVFYSRSALPEAYRHWLDLNPLTFIIESARQILMGGGMPWGGWCVSMMTGTLVAAAGLWCFCYSRRGFADVL